MTATSSRPIRSGIAAIAPRLVFAAFALCALGATAQPKAGEGPPGQRGGPPPEALAACQSSKAGDACSFSGNRGAATGSCLAPQGRPLACRPKDAPAPGGKTPIKSTQ